ncbi:putative reverse transcriptase domain-containing protein [Tanacetum coccineum]|uniref:Reverse transcriptase domain-containing protein n=1 Tax=Tanacetum coccineum TaxID=301880 RepID=A0ABQ4YJ20_9ASTR
MKVSKAKLKEIPVVCEFPGVFLKDLSGLPLPRKVQFHIVLIPGATPVTKSPYHLEPTEFQELRFIVNFSKITKPLTLLTQKNKKFEWGDEQEIAFLTLKDMLCDALILALLEGADDFVVYRDASNQGFSCVLMQRNKVKILEAQSEASKVINTLTERLRGFEKQLERKEDNGLYFVERIRVPAYGNLRTLIMNEAHTTKYYVHPGADKEITDKIVQIKERLIAARDRQKSYAENRRKPLEFSVGDKVLLKVSPWKGAVRFGKRSKLLPRYVGLFEVVERVGHVSYRFRLPQELVGIHDTFHVSNLKKFLADVNLHVPLKEIKIDDKLRFVEEPMEIMDRKVKKLKKVGFLLSSQIQELTNQVLILQSQKHKLELEKNKAEAALLKAQPSFPNVGQLNELIVKSLQTEFSKILSAYDFSSSLPTELKELPSKFNELTEVVKGLKKQVHELEIELPGDLKEIPNKLEDFTKTVTSLTS